MAVSLFTREWIEIKRAYAASTASVVSLFTREWIEIACSGVDASRNFGLPLYEGVD